MNRTFAVVIALAIPVLAACDKSGQDQQQKADKAQATANHEITNAQVEANEKATNAQATADKKIAEAEKDFSKTREDYRHDMQSNLDNIDKKIADLEVKAKKATGKKRADLDASIPVLKSQRDAFSVDMKTIETANATSWDATKARIDKQWTDLKKAADKVD